MRAAHEAASGAARTLRARAGIGRYVVRQASTTRSLSGSSPLVRFTVDTPMRGDVFFVQSERTLGALLRLECADAQARMLFLGRIRGCQQHGSFGVQACRACEGLCQLAP